MAESRDPFMSDPLELPGEPSKRQVHMRPLKKRRLLRRFLISLFVALIVGLAGFIGYKVVSDTKPSDQHAQTSGSAPASSQSTSEKLLDVQDTDKRETYRSARPRVEFEHPETWTVSEKEGGIRITSPEFYYTDINGSELAGYFKIYIRQGARTIDSKYIGDAVASLESEKITYADPVVGQRGTSNLSFFGLNTSDHFAYFFVAGNYSLKRNQSLGPDYGKEAETYIIAGGYSSPDIKDDLGMHKVSLDYFQTTVAYAQAISIISSLKLL